MRIAEISLLAAVLSTLSVFTSAAPTAVNTTNSTTPDLGAGASDQVFTFGLQYMPPTLAGLTHALKLDQPLESGIDNFAIVNDPTVKPGTPGDHRVLRSLYPKGSYSGSKDRKPQFQSDPLPESAFATNNYFRLEYQLMFKPGFNFVKGGKLPGILSGSEEGCNAHCSGGGSGENCFSTRIMFRAKGEGELYLYAAKSVYFPDEKPSTCSGGSKRSLQTLARAQKHQADLRFLPDSKSKDSSCLNGMGIEISPGATIDCNPTYGISIGRGGQFQFKTGVWQNLTQIVRVNSPGKAIRDGHMEVWLDGQPVIRSKELVLMKNGFQPNVPAQFMFSSFFGGSTRSYATPTDTYINWRGFKFAASENNIWTSDI